MHNIILNKLLSSDFSESMCDDTKREIAKAISEELEQTPVYTALTISGQRVAMFANSIGEVMSDDRISSLDSHASYDVLSINSTEKETVNYAEQYAHDEHLAKLLEIASKQDEYTRCVNISNLCENEFELYGVWFDDDMHDLRTKPIHTLICTDTLVGIWVMYMNDEPVCIIYKPYRKADESYIWLSEIAYRNVKAHMSTLYEKVYNSDIHNGNASILTPANTLIDLLSIVQDIQHKSNEKKYY